MFPLLERLLSMKQHHHHVPPANGSANWHGWLEGLARAFSVIYPTHSARAIWHVRSPR